MTLTFRVLPGETRLTYSPVGVRPLDEFTGGEPLGRVRAVLERQDGTVWRATGIKAVLTPGGVLTWPGLGRRRELTGAPARYRVRLEADLYRPFYRAQNDAVLFGGNPFFDAPPFNDTSPPPAVASLPQDELLVPAAGYPFPTHVRVARGRVLDQATGQPMADVAVSYALQERVLTDERGAYALPLRWAPFTGPIQIDANDLRTARTGFTNITLPQDLGGNIEILVP